MGYKGLQAQVNNYAAEGVKASVGENLPRQQEKTMPRSTLIAAALAAAFALPAFAQTATPATPATPAKPATAVVTPASPSTPIIDKREAKQEARIEKGVRKGQLTDREAANLEKKQARIKKMEADAKADGKVTAKERAKITHAQNKEGVNIAAKKHNMEKAPAPK